MTSSWIPEQGGKALAVGAAAAAGAACAAWWLRHTAYWRQWPEVRCSPRNDIYLSERQPSFRRRVGYQSFPLPYPNGWAFVCASASVPREKVIPIEVCGRHLVVFRAADGTVGALDAYCPHMGTHLGYGGYVSGDCVVCPYHQWEFDATGKLQRIPYAPENGRADCQRERNNLRSYPVEERHGMVFVWIHADNAEPWDMSWMPDAVDKKRLRPITRFIEDDYLMHCMEPSHNSCDWYHFSTVHSRMCQHWLQWFEWMKIDHTIRPARSLKGGDSDDDGNPIKRPDLLIVDEDIKSISFLNGLVKLPSWFATKCAKSQVRFTGPMLPSFFLEFPFFGTLQIFMPLTPTAPFVTHVEFWSFAGPRFPWLLAYLLTRLVRNTVSQDREVWEHRAHPMPRNWVKGDYNWGKYDKWLMSFYSESSIRWDSDDLSW